MTLQEELRKAIETVIAPELREKPPHTLTQAIADEVIEVVGPLSKQKITDYFDTEISPRYTMMAYCGALASAAVNGDTLLFTTRLTDQFPEYLPASVDIVLEDDLVDEAVDRPPEGATPDYLLDELEWPILSLEAAEPDERAYAWWEFELYGVREWQWMPIHIGFAVMTSRDAVKLSEKVWKMLEEYK